MKLFICSDIHGFYTIFKNSLEKSGYNKKNPDHKLIIIGDYFDIGPGAKLVKKFILESNAILIRGNQDDSLIKIYETGYLKKNNFINGTFDTMKQLGETNSDDTTTVLSNFRGKNKDLMELYSKMPYYYVIGDILFIHSWIPNGKNIAKATKDEWHNATLVSLTNKINFVKNGEKVNLNPYNDVKRIVFGHYKADSIIDMDNYNGEGVYTDSIKILKKENLTLYEIDGRVEETYKIPILILEV